MADEPSNVQGIINIYNRLARGLPQFEAGEGYTSAEQFRANIFTEGSRYAPRIDLDFLIAASTGNTEDHARGRVLVARVHEHVNALGFKDGKVTTKQPLREITFAEFNALPLPGLDAAKPQIEGPAQPDGPVKPPSERGVTQ